jgi:hypothetical protein
MAGIVFLFSDAVALVSICIPLFIFFIIYLNY